MTVPDGWEEKRLDEWGTIVSGSTPSTTVPAFWDGEIVWVTPFDLSRLTTPYLSDSSKKITAAGLQTCSAKLLPPGSVVLSSRAPIGYVALPTVRFCTNQGCKTILFRGGIDSKFAYYNVLFNIDKIKNLGEGTTFAEISKTALSTVLLSFPLNPSEQAKIAEVLSAVDNAIEQTEELIAKQQRIKTGLLQDLLTRGIDEHGNIRSEATHAFKDSPLGRIPAEWDVNRLDSVAALITSGSRGWARYYAVDGPLFLRIGNLTREHINLRLDDTVRVRPPKSSEGQRTAVAPRDLLISITADLGIIGVIPEEFEPAFVNQHIALVRLVTAKINSRFVGWFLCGRVGQAQFERLNESGAKAGINLPTVGRLLVPTMELAEQSRIVHVLDSTTRHIANEHKRLRKLQSLKAGLLQGLFTGRKRVTHLLEQPDNGLHQVV